MASQSQASPANGAGGRQMRESARDGAPLRRQRRETSRSSSSGWTRLPGWLHLGLAVFLIGVSGDLVYHALPAWSALTLEPLLGAEASRAHVVTLVGMVVIMAGVLRRGLSRDR
jgi:hypothetical protein